MHGTNEFAEIRSEGFHSMLPLLLVLARRLRFLVITPFVAACIALAYSLFTDPIYTATARILPPQYNENTVTAMQNELGGDSQLGNAALTLSNPTDLFVGILQSRTILDGVIDAHQLQSYYEIADMDDVRRQLSSATTIRAAKDGIVSISVEDTDARMAATLANTYVTEFYEFSESLARDQSRRRSEFYTVALEAARNELSRADRNLMLTEKETGYTRLAGQDEAIIVAASELQAQIAAREIQLQTMSSYATEANPLVQLAQSELKNLRQELARLRSGVQQTDQQPNDPAESPQSSAFISLGGAPDALLDYSRRQRDVEYWENIVMLIGRFSELGKIDERRDMSLFQVLDWAIAAQDKSKPRTRVNVILAGIATGFACLLLVLGQAYIQQRRSQSPQFASQWQELLETIAAAAFFGSAGEERQS